MIQLLAIFAFLLLGSGIALVVVWIIGTTKPIGPASPTALWFRGFWQGPGRSAAERRTHQTLLIVAVCAGALTWIFTGWPIGGLVIMLAIPGLPWLFASATAEKKAIARLSALEAWTRRLSDYVRNGIGLQAAIVATARNAPPLIGDEIRTLAARLQAGVNPISALRAFADDLDDYGCDEVVAPLILQLADAGEGLHAALVDVAHALTEEVNSRAMVDSERSTARFTVRFLTGFTLVLLVFGALNANYAAPYKSFLGQTILVVLAGLYIALMLWIRSLSLPPKLPRLLRADQQPKAPSTELELVR
ncbi:Flp pilus assembly protein TadB [Allocatelliglobosispora scoriae]|uniref:Flp pilus assembly protein TadB n=1 Tax=Allocatelliglobosispora scoriae TaxID=643052 RepID=A0A841BS33_9ACTN|nr:type II secretion system F family protein [Allocatelliglobosispora scoriae]MBB5869621.1 Flp pilus assembly protein TadB [Allocatelliglobosispora scoriae]